MRVPHLSGIGFHLICVYVQRWRRRWWRVYSFIWYKIFIVATTTKTFEFTHVNTITLGFKGIDGLFCYINTAITIFNDDYIWVSSTDDRSRRENRLYVCVCVCVSTMVCGQWSSRFEMFARAMWMHVCFVACQVPRFCCVFFLYLSIFSFLSIDYVVLTKKIHRKWKEEEEEKTTLKSYVYTLHRQTTI